MGAGASRPQRIHIPQQVITQVVNDGTKQHTKELTSLLKEAKEILSSLKEVEETRCNMCAICYENTIDTILDPCGHYALCKTCAISVFEQHGHCPMCRTPITKTMRVYLSNDESKKETPTLIENKGLQTTLPEIEVSDFRKTI